MEELTALLENFEISKSQRDKPQLLLNGYKFRIDSKSDGQGGYKQSGSGVYPWRCCTAACKAKITTTSVFQAENMELVEEQHESFCVPNSAKCNVVKMRADMKERGKLSNEQPRSIITQAQETLDKETIAIMPTYNANR